MSKGLKQMVSEALAQQESAPEPVQVSGDATRELARKMRQWSGWPDARLVLGQPVGSLWARCDPDEHTFTVNTDALVLNPNRVLLTVTPFRLRQEAVLTGAMLHEAGHARHSKWMSTAKPAAHSDNTVPTEQTIQLARLMEEARVEGLMARDAKHIGADTLDWTMRASAAHLAPMTALSADPNQQIMDLISSWALRAGRQYALEGWISGFRLRNWVQEFTTLLHSAILDHLTAREEAGALNCNPNTDTKVIIKRLVEMTVCDDDTGSVMVDTAREILSLLFPETPGETQDDEPMPSGGCSASEESSEGEQEEGEQAGEGEDQPEDGEADPSEGEGDSEPDQSEDEDEDSAGGASPSTEQGEGDQPEQSDLAKALAAMEAQAGDESAEEAEGAAEEAEEQAAGGGAGGGKGLGGEGGWRSPTKEEREMQKGAEKFLRNLIDASESSKISLTDTPSATVDGSALAAWKAGGQHTSPNFFLRTRREVEPSPPVKIAILVDVSGSMDELQKPSAVLSWELSAAALDLRNFAGRGQQVESCLIHWGWNSKVIQAVGQTLPGIKVHECDQGTSDMHGAMALVEQQMPGFFDASERPVNRLLVQFTDWELWNPTQITPWISRALASGVNMLTVAPEDYSPRNSVLSTVLSACKTQRGASTLLKYNKRFPEKVWETAAQVLS